ncbi:leucine-rich repeat-containing protein 71 isoform X2 [Hemicordylus capensis]|uniref:leucine-rich repeat-containing protein 71 isoform X2 n=1 Tax=Hemicordylus capensis TaxID=884348 RepID=UPI0023043E82|nr:leucine-rich repeat-containing protein 71 isoform X2 [Hemicordylus capensis]
MGKKGERGAKDKTAALEEEARLAAKRAEHGEEEYQCTGILEQDFTELCTRAGFQEVPKVVVRPHPHALAVTEEPDQQAEKDAQYSLSQIQGKYAYFRPTIQMELEHDDPKSTREIFIRSWKIEEKMLAVLAKCLPALAHLQGIHLWKVGLTDHTFLSLLAILPTCTTLRTLALEGNPLPERSFYKLLIAEESPTSPAEGQPTVPSTPLSLAHISLRNNDIDDEAALLIGQALSSLKSANKNLVSINLSYNHITDVGAGYIADIGDKGALKLAEVLAPFALTHTEVVERRRLLLEKEAQDRCRMPQRVLEVKSDRPASHVSSTAIDKLQPPKTGKGTNKKKEQAKKEEKGQASGGGGLIQAASTAAQTKKEEAKQAKKAVPAPDQKPVRGKGAKSGSKDKRAQVTEVEVFEPTEIMNPLLEQAEHRDGKVFLPGNRVLIYLNLIRNQITEYGLQAFLEAMQQQSCCLTPGTKGPSGLMRLSLAKNKCPMESKILAQIQELMMLRDPLPKGGAKTAEDEQVPVL